MTILIVASDLHINSKVAISPRTIDIDDGGTYRASRGQRWLLDCWQDAIETISKDYPNNQRKILVLNGDLGELDTKRRSYQLITPNKAVIQRMILQVIEPMVDIADSVYIVRGTQAHVGKSAWLEEAIADDLDNAVHSPESSSWWHIQRKVEQAKVSIAHHAQMGHTPWTRANSASKLAFIASNMGIDLAVRSHNHTYADSGDNYPCKVFFTPCWTLQTEYGYRAGHELSLPDIGLMIFEIDGMNIRVRRLRYEPREDKKVWAIQM